MKWKFWQKRKLTRLEGLQKLRIDVKTNIKELQEHKRYSLEARRKYSRLYSMWRRVTIVLQTDLHISGQLIPKIDRRIKEIQNERKSTA